MRVDALPALGFADAADHIAAELRWLDRLLTHHIDALHGDGRINADPLRGLYLRESDVLAALAGPAAIDRPVDHLRAINDQRAALDPQPPLIRLANRCGLGAFERLALLIVAAPSLDRRFGEAYALAQNDATRRRPTISLLLDLLQPADRLASLAVFAPGASLFRCGLIAFRAADADLPMADRALAIDDRVVRALLGQHADPDPAVAPMLRIDDDSAPDFGLSLPDHDDRAAVLLLACAGDAGQRLMARNRARCDRAALMIVDGDAVLDHPTGARDLGRLIAREGVLRDAHLFVDWRSVSPLPRRAEEFVNAARDSGAHLVVAIQSARDAGAHLSTSAALLSLPPPDASQRRLWWRQSLGDAVDGDRLAWSHGIGADGISALSVQHANAAGPPAMRMHAHLPALMQPLPHRWARSDLVLSPTTNRQLDELTAFVSHWPTVLGDWGFGATNPQARHCLALFAGGSGTGKTMAAGVVAAAAGLDLYRVNLAAVFDKYIGETEKQLDRLFSAAARAGVAILFDEADVLFGSRTEVQSSHDRYANLSVAFLLQRIEAHEGLVFLASNLPRNMDEAFARRLSHVVHFPMPDAAQRLALWQRAFPPSSPLDPAIDWDEMASTFDLSGGNIRNAALAAAYLAAADGGTIGLPHLLRAVSRELEKGGLAPMAADFGRWDAPD